MTGHPIEHLPAPPVLERLTRSLAVLDAILSPDWEGRYYSFNAGWDAQRGERMASMRDGCGDDWFLLFSPAGAFLKGFAHESAVAAARAPVQPMLEGLPPTLAGAASEPAFSIEHTTFCGWCPAGGVWQRAPVALPPGADPDGARELLALLSSDPNAYREWAAGYFERDVPLSAITAIYAHAPLDAALAGAVDPACDLAGLAADLAEIGYPQPPSD